MGEKRLDASISDEFIMSKIYLIRGKKVMLDVDLAVLYSVETKQLKRAVRRNIDRFPVDFMYELTLNEFENLRCQFGTSGWESIRYAPMAFTEHGVIMLASILNSERAIAVNIQIVRIFTKMRELLSTHKEILRKLEYLEKSDIEQDEKIKLIFEYIKQLENSRREEVEFEERPKLVLSKGVEYRINGSIF